MRVDATSADGQIGSSKRSNGAKFRRGEDTDADRGRERGREGESGHETIRAGEEPAMHRTLSSLSLSHRTLNWPDVNLSMSCGMGMGVRIGHGTLLA